MLLVFFQLVFMSHIQNANFLCQVFLINGNLGQEFPARRNKSERKPKEENYSNQKSFYFSIEPFSFVRTFFIF